MPAVGKALGAQAGMERLSSIITEAAFRQVRKAVEPPFIFVLEAQR